MDILRKIGMQFKKPRGVFGKIISDLMIIGNRSAYDNMIRDLKLQANDKILEIGYGPGVGIDLISKRYEFCNIYGIDYSELMYKRASKRNYRFIKNSRVHLMFGDFVETELSTIGFDKIFCINVVYFWDNLQKPFEKVNSLLKDDGVFCLYMAGKDELNRAKFTKDGIFNKYSIGQVVNALKSSGFHEIDHSFRKGYFIKAKK
jgi:cyclopropane fatty-acyl-phospholipid synthase-like methyltransferase